MSDLSALLASHKIGRNACARMMGWDQNTFRRLYFLPEDHPKFRRLSDEAMVALMLKLDERKMALDSQAGSA